ncbi:14069_t:CDS:1, partial [Gigaspora rosea]
DFYEKLYETEEIDMAAMNKITNNLPQVGEEWNRTLVRPIGKEEILQTIQELPGNKSPGTDGLTYEFYKTLAENLAPILEVVFNNVIKESRMPSSWHKNILILIPKREENLEDVGNWRPISLVNSDAKIFMKILAGRFGSGYYHHYEGQ